MNPREVFVFVQCYYWSCQPFLCCLLSSPFTTHIKVTQFLLLDSQTTVWLDGRLCQKEKLWDSSQHQSLSRRHSDYVMCSVSHNPSGAWLTGYSPQWADHPSRQLQHHLSGASRQAGKLIFPGGGETAMSAAINTSHVSSAVSEPSKLVKARSLPMTRSSLGIMPPSRGQEAKMKNWSFSF